MSIVSPLPLFPDEAALRRCRKCGQDKPLTAFELRSDQPGRRRHTCRACKSKKPQGYAPIKRRTADEPWPCRVCGELKPLGEFVTQSAKRFSKGYHCLECDKKRQAKARAARRERGYKRPALTQAQKEHERWMQRKRAYGITKAEVLAMLQSQQERCALCLRALRLEGQRGYYVDHCHMTGRVRGLLCALCNGFLARIGDDEVGARRVLAYVLGNPEASTP